MKSRLASAGLLAAASCAAPAQDAPSAPTLREVTVSTPRGEVRPFDVPGSVDRVEGSVMRDARLGVNLSDQNPDVGGFLKQKNIRYTNLVGNDNIEKLYGPITGYPTTFIIDRDGTIREHFIGGQPPSVIENAVKQLL